MCNVHVFNIICYICGSKVWLALGGREISARSITNGHFANTSKYTYDWSMTPQHKQDDQESELLSKSHHEPLTSSMDGKLAIYIRLMLVEPTDFAMTVDHLMCMVWGPPNSPLMVKQTV